MTAKKQEITKALEAKPSLPTIPDDKDLLKKLQVGGVLKITPEVVLAAIRVALADQAKVFDVLPKLATRIKETAKRNGKPVPIEYYEVSRQVFLQESEVMPVLQDADVFALAEWKRDFRNYETGALLFALKSFSETTNKFVQDWRETAADPLAIMAALRGDTEIPTDLLLEPPNTSLVLDTSESLNDHINDSLSGVGATAAISLFVDAVNTLEILTREEIPALAGYANQELLFRGLDVAVGSELSRTEQKVAELTAGALKLKDCDGDDVAAYILKLNRLANEINWGALF